MNKQRGMTLIELVITIGIVGIISSIAWPYYERITKKQYRSEAIIAITEQVSKQETFKNTNGGYTVTVQPIASSSTLEYSKNKKFKISVSTTCTSGEGNECYKITATAQGTQADDTGCAIMTLDHLGRRLPKKCWSQ